MDTCKVESLGTTVQSKSTQTDDNSRPPLLPSGKNNTIPAVRKPRSVASRYMNGISSIPVSPSSNSKRCSSPISSHGHTSTVPGMSMPKRSQSNERRRPVNHSSMFSAPSSPSRPSTPHSPSSRPATPVRDVVTGTRNTTCHLISNKSRDGLWPSMRSLYSSLQSESLVVQERKREKLEANSSTVKSIKSPTDLISERKRTPLRRRHTSDQSENSKPQGNSNKKIIDQHRWPAGMGGRLPTSDMSRSLDLSDKISRSARTVVLHGDSPTRINLSSDCVLRNSKFSSSNASEQPLNRGSRKVELDVKISSSQINMRSSSATRPSSTQSVVNPGLWHCSSPSAPLSVIPDLHHPSLPTKVLSASASASRGVLSPWRTRPSYPKSLSTNVTSGVGGASCVFKCIGDVQRRKLTASGIEDAHQLKLLYNASLQWRFVNAQTYQTLWIQKMRTENLLQNIWNSISMLHNSVMMKRIDVHHLREEMRLGSILKEQMAYLEQWAALEKEHSSSLSGAIEALNASTLCLSITEGAKADITDMKNAVSSAVDILQAMGSCVCHLLSQVEGTRSLVSEIKAVAENENFMLDECMELLAFAAAEQVQEFSMRIHLMQLSQDACKLN